jgi:hypothetical protein
VALLLLSVGTIVDRRGAAYNICEKTVGYVRHFDKLKTIDNNASDGNHVFNIGIGLTWGGSRNP